ncbi:MAG: glycosyltransferase, partial [Bacteroidota bacterium]
MEKYRVLHVIKGLGRGGAERLLLSTIRNHDPRVQFTVVYFLPWKNQLADPLRSLGVEVYCLAARHVPGMLLQLPALIRLIRRERIQLIHGHLPWSGILARIAGIFTGTPVVYTEHNLVSKYKPLTRWNRLTFSWQAAVIAVSQKTADDLHQRYAPKTRIEVIPNGVEVRPLSTTTDRHERRKRLGIGERSIVIGTVAVFTRQKRLDRFIAICRELSSVEHVEYIIVGDGLLRPALESQAGDLVSNGLLTFTGLSDTPEQWLDCMDIFLSTSDYEGLPVALLEAMACGCVPVVTAVGGVPSVVKTGENGYTWMPDEPSTAIAIIRDL